jgi:hypothetical protein
MRILARFASVLFHPLIMPSLALLVVFQTGVYFPVLDYEQKRAIFLIVFLASFVIPLSFIPLFLLKGNRFNPEMPTTRERIKPFFLTSAVYLATWYFMRETGIPAFFSELMLSVALVVLLCSFVTIFWKISAHLSGAGGLTGLLFYISLQPIPDAMILLSAGFLMSGLLATSRIWLGAHRPAEAYAGFLLGFTVVSGSLFILAA